MEQRRTDGMRASKIFDTVDQAVGDVHDGATIMIGGFGGAGTPHNLVEAIGRRGTRGLTLICNGFNNFLSLADDEHASRIRKAYLSFPVWPHRNPEPPAFCRLAQAGAIEVEMVPQGTLAERIRAGGAGLAGFYTPVGAGTLIERGKEKRVFDGQEYLLERALKADFALIKAHKADPWGNLVYRMSGRNFNPLMAMAAKVTIVEVDEVQDGPLDPEVVATPGIFVDRVVTARKKTISFGQPAGR